uniref:Uncharacterized protein n=1 Tax=Rhizophora mucronata TaxID=61149 RepID=A0A2P2JC88_RHIMU
MLILLPTPPGCRLVLRLGKFTAEFQRKAQFVASRWGSAPVWALVGTLQEVHMVP